MKKHRCVEWGGCKAADCDGSLELTENSATTIAVDRQKAWDKNRKAIKAISKSQTKRLKIQTNYDKLRYEYHKLSMHLIQCIANGLELSPILVEEYNELQKSYVSAAKQLISKCNERK